MSSSREQQFFVGGFSLGLFAGVAGYYLFGTKQGSKLRKELSSEWEQAQNYLEQQGVLSKKQGKQQSLAEFLTTLKDQILLKLEVDLSDLTEEKKNKAKKKRLLPKKTDKESEPNKFFGI